MDSIRTIENGRAKFAYERAQEIATESQEKRDKYRSQAKKLPMMIKINGLGPTLAFVKTKTEYNMIYQHISRWIKENPRFANDPNFEALRNGGDMMKFVIQRDTDVYKMITIEILAFLNWLRRFADGLS